MRIPDRFPGLLPVPAEGHTVCFRFFACRDLHGSAGAGTAKISRGTDGRIAVCLRFFRPPEEALRLCGKGTAEISCGTAGKRAPHIKKTVAPSGERGLRPGRAHPRRMTKNGRMFFASVTAFHYTCLPRFCQPTKRQNPYPFPKKHPPQIRFPPGVRRCIQQMLFLRFPGGFNLPKVGF